MIGWMASQSGVHYLLVRDFLGPWAKKFGATQADWQQEVFDDLTTSGRCIKFAPSSRPLEIAIVGKRFWSRGTGDERRDDTIFLFELHAVTSGAGKPLTAVEATWRLSRGDQRMPAGQDITEVPCFRRDGRTPVPVREHAITRRPSVTLTPTPDLRFAIAKSVGDWKPEKLQRAHAVAAEANPRRLLEQMRSHYRSQRRTAALLPIDEGERLILTGARTPADSNILLALHHKFGVPILEQVRLKEPKSLDTAIEALVDLPAPQEVLELLTDSWINANSSERDARKAAAAIWKERALQSEQSPADASLTDEGMDEPSQVNGTGGPEPHLPEPSQESVTTEERLRLQLRALRGSSLLLSRPQLFAFADSVLQLGEALNEALSELPDFSAAERVRGVLDDIAARSTSAPALFPSGSAIAALDADVEGTIERVLELGELGAARNWLERITTWDSLEPVLRIAALPDLEELPNWFFRELTPTEATRNEALMGALADERQRPVVEEALRWIASMRESDPASLDDLRSAEPGSGDAPIIRLQSAIDARSKQKRLRTRFEELATSLGSWVSPLWETSELAKDDLVQSLEEVHRQIRDLIGRAPQVTSELTQWVADAAGLRDAHERVREIEAIFARLEDLVADLPNLASMRKAFARFAPTSAKKPEADGVQGLQIELSHCVSEGPGGVRAARLIARQGPQPALFLTDIPFHLKSSRPQRLELTLHVNAPHLANRPSEWRAMVERRVVEVPEQAWFEIGSGQWAAPLVLSDVPVVRGKEQLHVAISGEDRKAEAVLPRAEFSWSAPHFEMPAFDLPFSDVTSPEEMQKHPLGIQSRFDEILQTINGGRASFLVAAPRRFGKTTLLSALTAATAGSNVVVVGPIRSSVYKSVSEAFEEACVQVAKQLGVYVSTDWKQANLLPRGDTFDLARKAAHDQKKTAIYFLFDEAQALFRRRGRETAEQLKVLIETAWGLASTGMVPIRIGLVGQLHLPRMIQGQLEGMFATTIQQLDIAPLQIQRLLQKSTRDVMQSTADAREMLARISRNLYILRLLLGEIRTTLIQEQRTWFVRTDVERAVAALIDQAVQTASTQLVSYLRDPLNGSYDLTQWQPVPAYLVAVAWAVALVDAGSSTPARLERARELIEEWSRQVTPRSSVPTHRIEECVKELHDLAVLDHQDRFRSDLLARYFERLARGAFQLREDAERQAMQKLLVDVVALPESMEQIGQGGQATVYYCESDEREEAIRVVELPTDAARVAFVETCYALKAIEGTRSRHAGYLSLPVVRQAGLALDGAADEECPRGAVKYDWVTGTDLGNRRKALTDPNVVAIGRAMAEALVVLEQRKVVHRDIRPENIVIGPGGNPVLVDFGLARLADHMTHTRVYETEYLAPEVKKDPPAWSSQSDVFALAMTLDTLRGDNATNSPLGRVLSLARDPDPAKRLTPSRLVAELGALADKLNLESSRVESERIFAQRLQRFPSRVRWAHEVGRTYLPDMVASAMGAFDEREVLLCVASFLDDMFAGWYLDQFPGSKAPHISSLDATQLPAQLHPFCINDVTATGFLRHGRAHREKQRRNIDIALQRLGVPRAPQPMPYLRRAVLAAAQRFDRSMPLPGIHDLVQAWLPEPRQRR